MTHSSIGRVLAGGLLAFGLAAPATLFGQQSRPAGDGPASPRVIVSTPTPRGSQARTTNSDPTSDFRERLAKLLPEAVDPAYENYTNIELLGRAWGTQDAALLADLGLQLAEGERVVLRPHRGLEGAKVLELAARIAGERRDKATLDRLTRAAESRKDAGLAAALVESRKACSRKAEADFALADHIEHLTPERLALHQAAVLRLRAARLAGDPELLAFVEKKLDAMDVLHDTQDEHVKQLVDAARRSMPKEPTSLRSTVRTLDRLMLIVQCGRPDCNLEFAPVAWLTPCPPGMDCGQVAMARRGSTLGETPQVLLPVGPNVSER